MHKLIVDNLTQIKDICKKYHISYLGLFGSYARGDQTEESDIDFAADFPPKTSLLKLGRIQRELEALLHKKIDLVARGAIKENRKKYILPELKKIYSS